MKVYKTKSGKNKGKDKIIYSDEFKRSKFKIKSKFRKKKSSRFDHSKRFLSELDLAEAKRMESITNSQIKRGEIKKGNYARHYVCGCGSEGCIGHNEITLNQ